MNSLLYFLMPSVAFVEPDYQIINVSPSSAGDLTGFVNTGFAFDGTVLKSNNSPAYNSHLYFDQTSNLDKVKLSVNVKFNSLNSIVGLFRKSGSIAGTYGKVDLVAGKLIFCNIWNGNDAPVNYTDIAISQPINTTDTYTLALEKSAGKNYLSIKNTATDAYDELFFDNGNLSSFPIGCQWGRYGISNYAGNVSVLNFNVSTKFSETPNYACYGDSITEGNSLIGLGNNYDDRWAAKLAAYDGNVLISGMGGDTSGGLVTRFAFDFQRFTPVNTVIFIGANDGSFGTWQGNVNNLISQIVAKGSHPIICTLLPRDGIQTFLNEANAYILGTLSATCTIWDFSAVLTLNGDRVTRNSSYFLSDNVHPNIAGHEALWQYILTQLQ